MSKIIKITENNIYVGKDDGQMIEVDRNSLNWEPELFEEVEIYKSNNEIIVVKAEKHKIKSVKKGNVVNKGGYIVLAILLGGIGMHKFFAGQVGMGLFYLLFCWTFIPVILAFIEAIIAACTPADENGNIII